MSLLLSMLDAARDGPSVLNVFHTIQRQLSVSELAKRFVTYATESKSIAGLKEELRLLQDACTFEIDARKVEVDQLNEKMNRLTRERLVSLPPPSVDDTGRYTEWTLPDLCSKTTTPSRLLPKTLNATLPHSEPSTHKHVKHSSAKRRNEPILPRRYDFHAQSICLFDLTSTLTLCPPTSIAHCCHHKARRLPPPSSSLLSLKLGRVRLVELLLRCPRSRRPDRSSRTPRKERQTQDRSRPDGEAAGRACEPGASSLVGLLLPSLLPRTRLPSTCSPASASSSSTPPPTPWTRTDEPTPLLTPPPPPTRP